MQVYIFELYSKDEVYEKKRTPGVNQLSGKLRMDFNARKHIFARDIFENIISLDITILS
jgi:hypothetical protein